MRVRFYVSMFVCANTCFCFMNRERERERGGGGVGEGGGDGGGGGGEHTNQSLPLESPTFILTALSPNTSLMTGADSPSQGPSFYAAVIANVNVSTKQ